MAKWKIPNNRGLFLESERGNEMTIQEFVKRFKYRPDGWLDRWRFLDRKNGPIEGDCDDFACSVLRIVEGDRWLHALWTGRAELWFVITARGVGHLTLRHKEFGWICNIYPQWRPTCQHEKWFRSPLPLTLVKLLFGKILG